MADVLESLFHKPIAKVDENKDARQKWFDLLADEGVVVRRAFQDFVNSIQSSMSDNQILRWITERDLKGFLEHISEFVDEFADVLPDVFTRAAHQEIERLGQPGLFGIGKDRVNFDVGNKRAARVVEKSRLRLIKEINTSQRDAIKEAISNSIAQGSGPRVAARQFRDAIGLTRNQVQAVNSYQALLENNSRQALNRALRDARFDSTVERAISEDDVLSAKQIERMVGRYTQNMINHRAETIARTETMRTLNEAKQESWKQIAEQLDMEPTDVERTWVATLDDRTRDTHAEMNGQTVTGMDTEFESPSGETLLYPGDPFADGSETINCRCTLVVKFPYDKMRMSKGEQRETLYVSRPVQNAEEIIAWAKDTLGLESCITPEDMHVTIAFSREAVVWPKAMKDVSLTIYPQRAKLALFGPDKNVLVLKFSNDELSERWAYFRSIGASWDWPSYEPHITLSYNAPAVIPDVTPYNGAIKLASEKFAPVKEDWGDDVVEKAFDPDEPRDEHGRWVAAASAYQYNPADDRARATLTRLAGRTMTKEYAHLHPGEIKVYRAGKLGNRGTSFSTSKAAATRHMFANTELLHALALKKTDPAIALNKLNPSSLFSSEREVFVDLRGIDKSRIVQIRPIVKAK